MIPLWMFPMVGDCCFTRSLVVLENDPAFLKRLPIAAKPQLQGELKRRRLGLFPIQTVTPPRLFGLEAGVGLSEEPLAPQRCHCCSLFVLKPTSLKISSQPLQLMSVPAAFSVSHAAPSPSPHTPLSPFLSECRRRQRCQQVRQAQADRC
jgi:hypothetical protein